MDNEKGHKSIPDIVLVLGSERFKCNKEILANSSGYFKSMFSPSGFSEANATEVEIHDITPEILKILLRFAYSKHLSIPSTISKVHALLQASSIFQFDNVQKAVVDYLIENLSVENCVKNFIMGDSFAIVSLRKCSKMYIIWDLFCNEIALNSSVECLINKLSFDVLYELLSSKGFRTKAEGNVCLVVALWAQKNICSRDQSQKLMKCIIATNLHKDSISQVKQHSLYKVKQENLFLNLVEELCHCSDVCYASDIYPRVSMLKPILFTLDVTKGLINFHLLDHDERVNGSIEVLDLDYLSLERINMKTILGVSICSVGESLFILGGRENYGSGNWNTKFWKYNSFTRNYTQLSEMPRNLRHVKCASDNESIYIAGGFGVFRVIANSLFQYHITEDLWEELPELPIPGSNSFSVCVHEGVLYLFAGGNGVYLLDKSPVRLWRKVAKEFGLHGSTFSFIAENEILVLSPQEDSYMVFNPECCNVTRKVRLSSSIVWDTCLVVNEEIFLFDSTEGVLSVFNSQTESISLTAPVKIVSNFTNPCVLPVVIKP